MPAAASRMLKKVTIARDMGSAMQLDGVKRNERIIDSPPDGIADGDTVKVAQAAPAAAAAPRKAG
jgi:hypothetical protein